jgi:peptide/nickel transport system substrate-binding protein
MAMKKLARAAALVLTMVFAGSLTAGGALAQDEGADTSTEKLSFTVGMVNDAITFNPLTIIETPEYETVGTQYNYLLGYHQDTQEPVPEIGDMPERSEDGLTWTFHVPAGRTWSDGEPLTAEDVAYTYNLILDEGFSAFSDYLPFTDEIVAPDPETLVWSTTKPTGAPLYPPAISILPEHMFSQFEDKDAIKKWKGYEDPEPVTSGPFHMVEWVRGEFWRLEANPDYWQGAPNIDELRYQIFKNEESMVEALKQGQIDYAEDIPVNLAEQVANTPGITLHEAGQAYFVQMSFNMCTNEVAYCADNPSTGHPALLDQTVRDAVALAINKQELVEKVKRGYGEVGTTVTIPTNKWHFDPENQYTQDVAAANAMLDEAGYEDTDGDGVREMPGGGEPLNFRFVVRTENPDTIRAGEFITAWLEQIGMSTETQPVTDTKLTDIWYANDYDLYIWGWGVEPDPDFQLSTYTTGQCGVWSDTCYSNPEYDKLYNKQRVAKTLEDRVAIVNQMQQIIYDEKPEIVLWYDTTLQAHSNQWTGFVEQPQPQGFLLFQYGTYSYRNIRPAAAAGASDGGGPSPLLWVGLGALVVVVIVAIAVGRRRSEEDEA